MLPNIIISQNTECIEGYIQKTKKDNKIKNFEVLYIRKEKTRLSIDSIRNSLPLIDRGGVRMVVIYDFDTAKDEVQNALLKSLEEKSDTVLFILASCSESGILPTIISRCSLRKIDETNQPDVVAFSYNPNSSCEEYMAGTTKIEKDAALALIDSLCVYFRTQLVKSKQAIIILRVCMEVRMLILNNNLNAECGIDRIAMELYR